MSSRHPSYGSAQTAAGSRIASVDPGSPADDAGLLPGHIVRSAAGFVLRDAIDWQWVADGPRVEIEVEDDDATAHAFQLEREPGQSWGFEFAEALFDGVRVCANDCTFCFMSQLPRGLRPSLYLRDDDYRLSFTHGNFVTFTNLADEDIDRIVEQHLSPLYVSLHAVDPDVRSRLLCSRGEDRTLEILDSLGAEGIGFHAQVVLLPGENDGEILEQTIAWCLERDHILSLGVVPVGRTRHAADDAPAFRTKENAAALLASMEAHLERATRLRGPGWFQLADEFYLTAEKTLPAAGEYGDFPQLENGVGMARTFVDSFQSGVSAREGDPTPSARDEIAILTGELFAPTLVALLDANTLAHVKVLPVANGIFGGGVNVAGLLSGRDIIVAVRDALLTGTVLLPAAIFNSDGLTLDDMTLSTIQREVGGSVTLVSCVPEALPDALAAPGAEA